MDSRLSLTPRQESLLLLVDIAASRNLDPVRIMKGMFLIAMEAPAHWFADDARYEFEPYHYGPYSKAIYRDIETLERMQLLDSFAVLGQSWSRYAITNSGSQQAGEIRIRLPSDAVEYVGQVVDFVTRASFGQLLDSVYKRYPAFAVNSVFNISKTD